MNGTEVQQAIANPVKIGSIFLSYAGTDREAATRLKDRLTAAGAEIWQDIEQIRVGDNWIDDLQDALGQCSAYVILIGAGGIQRWVKAELAVALKRHFDSNGRFPLYPFLLPGVTPEDLPPFLGIFQAQRLAREPTPADYRRLAERICAVQEAPQEQRITAIASGVCPFAGLESYDEETARFYFGRQTETLEALALLGRARDGTYRRWLQVEGPSGVGKSSLVRAGMIPAIRRGWIEAQGSGTPRNWRIAIMRPGSDPVFNLAAALSRALPEAADLGELARRLQGEDPEALRYAVRQYVPPGQRFLLIVDQLEEIFAIVEDAGRRGRFDALLAAALQDRDGGFHLITTIRSDFTLRLSELPRLAALLNPRAERYYLEPIGKTGLRDVVNTPARLAGLTWDEPTLPERIVNDAAKTPSPLPLVSNLLRLLWQQRTGHTLHARVYEELGGVGGALARSADALLASLGEGGRERARGLLLRLVKIGRDSAPTRRTITRATALRAAGGGPAAEHVLNRLSGGADPDSTQGPAGARLIVVSSRETGETTARVALVDLAHEALLTRWETLHHWIETQRDRLEAGEALEAAARQWQDIGRPRWSGLPSGGLLKRYRQAIAPSELAGEFLQASRRLVGLHRRLAGLAAGLVVAVAVGTMWLYAHGLTVKHGETMLLSAIGLYRAAEPEMVEVPPGEFWMGSRDDDPEAYPHEMPRHRVSITRPFAIGKYEVTFDEYERFAYATGRPLPSDQGWGKGRRPVINVSWDDATAYAGWLSKMTGKRYRLPTEAEWEYAARAGTEWARFWGDDPDKACRYANVADQRFQSRGYGGEIHNCDDGYAETAEVGSFKPNDFGLHDMLGNVWEWVQDCPHDYEEAPGDGSAWEEAECGLRVIRGGSWNDEPRDVRSADRFGFTPGGRGNFLGFRLARDL